MTVNRNEVATLASGCFWCTEAIYRELAGVDGVISGYSGGNIENPTYDQVCSGYTGYAEAVQITFDPDVISFAQIVEVFFLTHNPTTLNKQGNDEGTQYRSAIFYRGEEQKRIAEEVKAKITKDGVYSDPIVTEVVPFACFYPAERYHQEYYEKNQSAPYCQFVIDPKLSMFREKFFHLLKKRGT